MSTAITVYLTLIALASAICYAAYGWVKRQATTGGRRVSENTLHILAMVGGWPGALLAQRQFRHKTQKLSFLIAFWFVVTIHVAIVGAAVYVFAR